MNAFASIAQLVEIAIAHWEISLLVLMAFTVLFIWLFKGVKGGIKATVAVLLIGALLLVVELAVQLVGKGITETVAFAVAWVPTVLFLLIVIVAALVGIRRGLRKSLILAVQAFCAAGVCIGLYFFCISGDTVDGALLNLVNAIMGENGLQNALHVSAECDTLRECFAEFIPTLFSYGSEVELVLRENGAYLWTLADLVYRIGIAVILWLVYFLLVFLLYLVYAIFYPERKYKRKREAAFANGTVDCSYKRNRVGGGIVGFVRGLVVGLVTMSFIGSAFFMVAGGTGDGELADRDFHNDDTNFYYTIYRSVESYGAQGIFKVLNSMRDVEDSPYYLFAADLVFSGELDDDINDVHGNVSFRKEVGAYTGFAKDTASLLLKYGGQEIEDALQTGDSGHIMDVVVEVMKGPEFRAEFENLFDHFDSQTYVINFSLSMVGTVVAHLDDMSFASSLGESNVELLKVLFQRGYLSETIPDEKELREKLGAEVTDDPLLVQPYLSVNHLFDKRDAQTVLRVALSFLAGEYNDAEPIDLIKEILPELEHLSILGTERKGEVNPVMGRLYCFLENTYLTEEGQSGVTHAEIKAQNISWVDELHALIKVTDDMFTLYDNVKSEDGNLMQTVLNVFDDANPAYEENLRLYDNICATVTDSAVLGKVLASGKMTGMLRDGISGIGENVYLPDKIVFENRYDGDGNLLSHGETFHIFYGLRLLGDKQNKELFDLLFDSSQSVELTDLLDMLSEAIVRKDGLGISLADYLSESAVLRSVVSSVFIEQGGEILAVPYSSREKNAEGEAVNFIVKDELKQVFDSLPEIVELIKPFLDGGFEAGEVKELLDDETLRGLLDRGNGILEGTIASILVKQMNGNGLVVIPAALDTKDPANLDGWATDLTGRAGELRNLVTALDELDSHLEEILNGELGENELVDLLGDMDDAAIGNLLGSQVLHYTFSKALLEQDGNSDGFTLIIPASATIELENDVLQKIVKKQELHVIFTEFNSFGFSSEMDAAEILKKLVANKQKLGNSNIISASIVHYIVNNEEMNEALSMPDALKAAGKREELERYGETSLWYPELPALVDGLDELFGISAGEENVDMSEDGITDRMSVLVRVLDTPSDVQDGQKKLEVVYDSVVIRHNLTERLDESFADVVEENTIAEAKEKDGYYRQSEVGALSGAVNVFDIEIFDETADIQEKVKDKALRLNDKAEKYPGKTNLDVVYPSVIVRSMITDEIDDAVTGTKTLIDSGVLEKIKGSNAHYSKKETAAIVDGANELEVQKIEDLKNYSFDDITSFDNPSTLRPATGETRLQVIFASQVLGGIVTYKIDENIKEDLLDPDVRSGIKDEYGIYSVSEAEALLGAMEEFGIDTLAGFKEHNFVNDIKTLNDPDRSGTDTRLDVLYSSSLAGGILTKKVQSEIGKNSYLADHSKAYREDVAIYRKEELRELVSLAGGKDISDYELGSTDELKHYVEPVANGPKSAPRSYLAAAALTKNLLSNDAFVVPAAQMDGESVYAVELTALVNAFTALNQEGGKLSEWDVSDHLKLPAPVNREIVTDSVIMRATLTEKIIELNGKVVVGMENATAGKDVKDRAIAVLSQEALLSLFHVLDRCGTGDSLGYPKFDSLAEIYAHRQDLKLLCEFEAIRYRIGETLMKIEDKFTPAVESVYVLEEGKGGDVIAVESDPAYKTLTYEQIEEFLETYTGGV